MSKYVDKKHGLIIGSDNWFFIADDEHAPEGVEKFRDGYKAIVWAKNYSFPKYTFANAGLLTPINQMLWATVTVEEENEFEGKRWTREKDYRVLKHWPRHWLTTHVGPIHDKWDVRTMNEGSENSIFFKRRTDALAFVNVLEDSLAGMGYL